jgi:hypothetical protein
MHRTNPAWPAAAVLMLVWAVAVPAAGGLISDVGAIPNPSDGLFFVTVDVNSFKPLAGGWVEITLGSHDGTATISVYNMAGTLVRTLESQDTEIRWYGDNDGGDSVASGVYFLRIQMGESESIRKVAVIR